MEDATIVMDTNILFAGLYSSVGASYQILRMLYAGKIKTVISTPLLFEYEYVLRRERALLNLTHQQVDIVLDTLCALSTFQEIHFLWRPYLKDPKDDHILEVAVASQTKIIVTHNLKDFNEIGTFGVTAMTPGRYLEAMR